MLSDIPQSPQSHPTQLYPLFQLDEESYTSEVEGGELEYDVATVANNLTRNVTIDPDGKVVEVEQEVALITVPAAVRDGLRRKAGTGRITKVISIKDSNAVMAYEAKVLDAGKKSEVQVGADGKVLEVQEEVALNTLPVTVRAGLQHKVGTGRITRVASGELLESEDQGVFYFREEMSLRPRADLSHMRYMEITVFHVRPGKEKQWTEVVKMAKSGYEKGVPDSHWGMFEELFGADGGTYLLLSSHKSLAEIDKSFGEDKQFEAAMGEDGMKKLDDLYSECCEASQHQLFAFSPDQSYVQDDWIKADPEFWKRKPVAAPTAKAPAEDKKAKP